MNFWWFWNGVYDSALSTGAVWLASFGCLFWQRVSVFSSFKPKSFPDWYLWLNKELRSCIKFPDIELFKYNVCPKFVAVKDLTWANSCLFDYLSEKTNTWLHKSLKYNKSLPTWQQIQQEFKYMASHKSSATGIIYF